MSLSAFSSRFLPRTRLVSRLLLIGFLIGGTCLPEFLPRGEACQICIPYPRKSVVDSLFESDTVVLAREDPDRPFHYLAIEALKGELPEATAIDLFLNSTTRRLLKTHPDRFAVLARNPANTDSPWTSLGLTSDAYGPLVREILSLSDSWNASPEARFRFFADRLNHDDDSIRNLARLEVARAPYREIRTLADVIPREELRAFLQQFRYIEWHPLYILLLANGATDADRERIREQIESAAKFRTALNLGAWATAYLEIDRENALADLERLYLANPDRNPEEVKEVLNALAVHGNGETTLERDRLVQSFALLLETHPDQAPAIVSRLKVWKRRDLTAQVQEIATRRPPLFDLTTLLQLRAYARSSRP